MAERFITVWHLTWLPPLQLHVELTGVCRLQVEFCNGAYSVRRGRGQQSQQMSPLSGHLGWFARWVTSKHHLLLSLTVSQVLWKCCRAWSYTTLGGFIPLPQEPLQRTLFCTEMLASQYVTEPKKTRRKWNSKVPPILTTYFPRTYLNVRFQFPLESSKRTFQKKFLDKIIMQSLISTCDLHAQRRLQDFTAWTIWRPADHLLIKLRGQIDIR